MSGRLRTRLLPWIVWATTTGSAAWLWADLEAEGAALGFAAGVEARARAPELGQIAAIRVAPGQAVRAGEVVAVLDDREIEIEASALAAERDRLAAALAAARSDRTIEHDADARALDEAVASADLSLQTARSERAQRAAERAALDDQREALAGLVDARMADRRDLDALAVKRAAVDGALAGADARVRALEDQAAAARARRGALPDDAAALALRPLEAELRAVDVREQALSARRDALELRAPAAGEVAAVHLRAGERVEAGAAVVTIVGPSSEAGEDVVLCLSDALARRVRVGEAVELRPRGAGVDARGPRVPGRVTRLAPRVAELPPPCRQRPDLAEWGREAYVAVDGPAPLLPGQAWTATFSGRRAGGDDGDGAISSLLGDVAAAATAARAPVPTRSPRSPGVAPRRRRRRRGRVAAAGTTAARRPDERQEEAADRPGRRAPAGRAEAAGATAGRRPDERQEQAADGPGRRASAGGAGVVLSAALLGGCLHAPAASPGRSVAAWRALEAASAAASSAASGDAGGVDEVADPAARAPALTADQAYALALARSPALAVADARVDVATASIAAARQLENPTLRVTNFDLDDVANGRPGPTLGLRAPIPRPVALRARVLDAELTADAAGDLADAARARLRVDVDRLFARLAWLRADVAEAEAAVAVAAARKRALERRVAAAIAPEVTLARADVDVAEAEDEAARVRDALARAEANLSRLVDPGGRAHRFEVAAERLPRSAAEAIRSGVESAPGGESAGTGQSGVVAVVDAAPEPATLDPVALTDRALRGRPELRVAQRRAFQADVALRRERRAALPWLSWAQVNVHPGAVGRTLPAGVGLGVALELPLFSWNRGAVQEARARVHQRGVEEAAEVAAVAAEVAAALTRLRQADARVRALEGALLPRVDAAVARAAAAADAGALDDLEVLDLEARRIAARRLALAARHERRDAVLDLEAAIGAPLDR